jgi:hypothetical protein
MRGGLFNPFFQNGYDLTGHTTGFIPSSSTTPTPTVLITTDSTAYRIDTTTLYTIDKNSTTT